MFKLRRGHGAALTALLAACTLTAFATTGGGPPARADSAVGPIPEVPAYTFVSSPDFINSDVGDVRKLSTWHPGDPNSWNTDYANSIDVVLDTLQAENPDAVLLAGDTVQGHWGQDVDHTGLFGPVDTFAHKAQAVRRAGNFYFASVAHMFSARHLPLYAAMGDHEIGDNPWRGGKASTVKRELMGVYKAAWARQFTQTPDGRQRFADRPLADGHRNTSYAVRLAPEVELVSIDLFTRTPSDVKITVRGAQLEWLDQVLAKAEADGVDWIIVQGHTPVLGPVRTRGSSGLSVAGGEGSAFWQTMVRHHVDLYLCGEVHATTAIVRDGIVQLSHGGAFGWGLTSYLKGTIYPDHMDLVTRDFTHQRTDRSLPRMWNTSGVRQPSDIVYRRDPAVAGTMTLLPDNEVVSRTGNLDVYVP